MHVHVDWNAVGLWVGVMSFLLAIPLAILGNILTPKFQRWWAKSAQNRAHLRLAVITKTLTHWDDYDAHPIDPVAILMKGVAKIVLGLASLGIGTLSLYFLSFPDQTLATGDRRIFTAAAYVLVIIGVGLSRWAVGFARFFRIRFSCYPISMSG